MVWNVQYNLQVAHLGLALTGAAVPASQQSAEGGIQVMDHPIICFHEIGKLLRIISKLFHLSIFLLEFCHDLFMLLIQSLLVFSQAIKLTDYLFVSPHLLFVSWFFFVLLSFRRVSRVAFCLHLFVALTVGVIAATRTAENITRKWQHQARGAMVETERIYVKDVRAKIF